MAEVSIATVRDHDRLLLLANLDAEVLEVLFDRRVPLLPRTCCHTVNVTSTPIVLCAEAATHRFEQSRHNQTAVFEVCDDHLAKALNIADLTEVPMTSETRGAPLPQ